MKKITMLLVAALVAVAMAGCASIQTASQKDFNGQNLTQAQAQDVAQINANNWGLYFLWEPYHMPIFTGSTTSIGSITAFEDNVTLPLVVNMATKKSKELGATKTVDMNSMVSSKLLFLFSVREVEVSTNAIK